MAARWKLAIFDLDGTLLDTIMDLANACNHALSVHGFPLHSVQDYRYFVGNGVYELIRRAVPEPARSEETLRMVLETYQETYESHSRDATRPYDGVPEMLVALADRGIQRAVLSNKPHIHVPELMEQYFPGLIDFSLGQREGVPPKPDPAGVQDILRHFSCSAQDCVYVGDTDVDMLTGRKSGMLTVGVTWGFRTKQELECNGAHVTIDKPLQLIADVVDNSMEIHYHI